MIKKRDSTILKGLSIMSVILWHYCMIEVLSFNNEIMINVCKIGMSIFTFISGYGIYQSYKREGLKNYWGKRFDSVYEPYLFCQCFLFVFYFIKKYEITTTNILDAILCSQPENYFDNSMWYIKYIFFWYLIFYLCYKHFQKKLAIYILNIISFIMIYPLSQYFLHGIYLTFCFPLGVVASMISENETVDKIIKKGIVSVVSIILCVIIYVFKNSILSTYIQLLLTNLFFISSTVAIVSIWIMISESVERIKIIDTVLIKLGDLSFYLYLTEWIFIFRFPALYRIIGRNVISFGISILLIFGSSIVLKYIYEKYVKQISKDFIGG